MTLNTIALQYRLAAMEASSTTIAIVCVTTVTCILAMIQGWLFFAEGITIKKLLGLCCLIAGIGCILVGQEEFKRRQKGRDAGMQAVVGGESRPHADMEDKEPSVSEKEDDDKTNTTMEGISAVQRRSDQSRSNKVIASSRKGRHIRPQSPRRKSSIKGNHLRKSTKKGNDID